MTRPLSPELARDFDALWRMRRTAIVDRAEWLDPGQASDRIPRITKNSHRYTLQDLSPDVLAQAASVAPNARLALFEVAVDFWPARGLSHSERLIAMKESFMALQRRLVPGAGRHQTARVMPFPQRTVRPRNLLEADAGKTLRNSAGQVVLRDRRPLSPIVPFIVGEEFKGQTTIYFGERFDPCWTPLTGLPQVQVKVYIKVKDNRCPLPKNEWRTRLEVTLNGPAAASLGINTLEDLSQANLRVLATTYMQLARPVAKPPRFKAIGRRNPLTSIFRERLDHIAERSATAALEHGNFTQLNDGPIEFRTEPVLTELIADALYDFTRSTKRFKSSGRMLKRSLRRPSPRSRKSLIHRSPGPTAHP